MLNILTCGLFYCIYKTIISIKYFTGKEDINPLIEVLFVFLLAGFILSIGIINMVVYKEMPNQIGMDNTEDKTVMIVLIDIVIALFIIFSAIIFAISVNYINIDRIFAVLRVIPFSI